MIIRPTVLVLGAGASMPYGFPSGRQLFFQIKRALDTQTRDSNRQFLWGKLLEFGFTSKNIQAFKSAMNRADPLSVDAFLEHREEFLNIGKLSIAITLIPYEDEGRLFNMGSPKDMPDSWYRYLMAKLDVEDYINFGQNKLSVITFNYDRSLEHYLHTAFANKFGACEQACKDALSTIPIIHVHGSLGMLPWQKGNFSRPYAVTNDPEEIRRASQEILVMSEKQDDAAAFQKAFKVLSEAVNIYFLGFGYHETNLRRLRMDRLYNKTGKYGTSVGLGTAEWRSISKSWRITFKGDEIDILKLFKNHHPL